MNSAINQLNNVLKQWWQPTRYTGAGSGIKADTQTFWVMVGKEVSDYVRSWRFYILLAIMVLTSVGSLYTALSNLEKLVDAKSTEDTFFFLKLFSVSDGTLPPFFVLLGFLGPLLGLTMGFDAINSEHNKGTLSRILAQPVPRDYVINAKFVASILVLGTLVVALTLLFMGAGLLAVGIPPSAAEFVRIVAFTIVTIVYIGFWLNLSVFFSVRFKQPATSALMGIAVWLFFVVFYPLIVSIVTKVFEPSQFAPPQAVLFYQKLQGALMQIIPGELYNQTVSTLLIPSVRSLGPLTMEQMSGAIPGPLPVGQSLLVVWPQLTGLVTLTLICFVLSYVSFMRREIRSR
jgi:ABC-2 type transport system permease protein